LEQISTDIREDGKCHDGDSVNEKHLESIKEDTTGIRKAGKTI